MKAQWISKNPAKPLRIFFAGFGAEPEFFSFLDAENENLMMIYDYSNFDLPPELQEILQQQTPVQAVGWSMGVRILSDLSPRFAPKSTFAALNGTLFPIHEEYGIHPEIYEATAQGFHESGQEKFFKRMFARPEEAKRFFLSGFKRTAQQRQQELFSLKEQILNAATPSLRFHTALISEKDKIIYAKNQRAFWQTRNETRILELPSEGHFCFYGFKSWNELFNRVFS